MEQGLHTNLKKARDSKGLNQMELAKFVGVSRSALAHYESGVREPEIAVLLKLSEVLDVSIDTLCGNPLVKEEQNQFKEMYRYELESQMSDLEVNYKSKKEKIVSKFEKQKRKLDADYKLSKKVLVDKLAALNKLK